ncbi:ABC transporter ATP-binding protein [Helicovermis profundi]|uniref:Sn-glycerol-3-phosphate ABC transporter ATP-binding protein UgpC n=1 Tax=Helicovermis profundi TaxID=3065157 RepID=A0AAU9E037_9FIRM|nr:sn-glycerol-3-phosphate ABC transporter ATP-binding protein UgpC [Clostridia bacterium S502]
MSNVILKKINKVYPNGFNAVKNIDLEIKDKEFMVLVGPSGCGKTTTLRMIAGLEEISDGELLIGEKTVNEVAPKDRNIAMVFQNYALYPHMTIYDNMAFGLKLRKYPKDKIKSKVENAASILGIEDLLKRKPKQLSGGQRQRVALGRAIVREPEVFLMDEPLSNLDAKLRVQTRSELIKLHNRLDTTFVYVTHDQTEAMTMGTRICVMNKGEIQQVDTPKNIYQNPTNTFVAGFIGSPQMNFMNSVIKEENGNVLIEYNGLKLPLTKEMASSVKDGGYIGKEVLMGIRSENILIDKGGFEVTVDVTELLGSEIYIYYSINGEQFIAKETHNMNFKIGDKITVSFDESKIHLFDKESGNKIINW